MSSSSGSDDDEAARAPPAARKMHDGYHGWMKGISKNAQDFTPTRIDAAPLQQPQATGNSAWNAAGTWEERDKSAWARERLKLLVLTEFRFEDDALGMAVAASSITRCEGEAKVVFSRGKKRCGYDISLKFAWTATPTGEGDVAEVTGHVEIHDFEDTSGEEYEVAVSVEASGSAHAAAAKNAVLKGESALRKILSEWKEELLQQ